VFAQRFFRKLIADAEVYNGYSVLSVLLFASLLNLLQ
jgi:hypothetical protein